MNFIVEENSLVACRQESQQVDRMSMPKPQYDYEMRSKRFVPLEHNIPPPPFADLNMMMEVDDRRERILPPPAVRRTSELKLPTREQQPMPSTPSTAATISTLDLISAVQKVERTTMEVTITVLSLDGLIAKKDEPKEKSRVLQELTSLSSHGLSLSKHGLSRLSSHGSAVREMLSRHSSHSSKERSTSMRDVMPRHSSHSSSEKCEKDDASMSISCHDKRVTDSDVSSSSDSSTSTKPEVATIVASFSHTLTQKNVLFTHLPSHPMELTLSTTIQPIAYWSAKVDLDDTDQALSTLKFKRPFVHKDSQSSSSNSSSSKYAPQKCSIKLSVSRNGKLITMGNADIIIHGNEDGERTISSSVQAPPKANKRKMRLGKISFPMFRAKGDNMSFGLRPDAKLRVLVHVNEPNATVSSRRDLSPEQNDFPIRDVMESSMYDSPMKKVVEPVETKTDSNCTEDDSQCDGNSTDEEIWEEYVVEDNELRQLREQLVKYENANKILKQEIAESRDTLQLENDKYEQFCSELKEMKQNADKTIESLRDELHVAKCEAVMLPLYETRISELLEELKIKSDALKQKDMELKEKDQEIACLRDDIQEIKTGFRSQVDALSHVDALLWDNESQADDQSVQTAITTQSQQGYIKNDKWFADTMREELSGIKNVFLRTGRRKALNTQPEHVAPKSVKWTDDEEKKSEDGNSASDDSRKSCHGGQVIIPDDPLMSDEDDANLVSDEEA
jgi:hypothetical protein